MTNAEQIRCLCVTQHVTLKELAEKLGESYPNFHARMQRNSLKKEELEKIAEVLGVKFVQYFECADGTIIK